MKKNKLLIGLLLLGVLSITACKGGETSSGSESTSGTSGSSTSQRSSKSMDDEEVRRYMEELKPTSVSGHLYVHYYRFTPSANEYNAFDVWAWPYKPKAAEGYRFDWKGRTQSGDRMSATGDPVIDKFGYVVADIDLTKTDYDGGWDDVNKRMGGKPMDFLTADKSAIDEQIGVQLVVSATRKTTKPGSFWENDGGNIYLKLEDFLLEGTESYHAFFVQDDAQEPTPIPKTSQDIDDPFKDDDGTNVTYGDPKYKDADWKDKPIAATSNKFKGIGVGYQIMVSSFADSDGDGNGDIYGIEQKLDYLQGLGVQALWLTPIQLSDSYHGYDISDYLAVDPKFGSKVSPAGELAGGTTSEATALADYKSLIDAAHAKGMVVIMDLVLNHTSTTNKWFIRSAQLNEELRGYYQWGNHETNPTKINQDKYWYPYGTHCYSYYAKFGSSMPELNYAYKSTREAVEDVALNWCEFGVDGFRMDVINVMMVII